MGTVINTITLEKGLRADFLKSFENGEPMAGVDLIMETTSTANSEKYGWLGNVPGLNEWVDERKLNALNSFNYTIANKDYEGTLSVDRNEIEDDQIGAIRLRIADLARKAKTHPWKLMVELAKNGTSDLCYDGQAFFSASHSEGLSGTQSNLVTQTGTTVAQIKADFQSGMAKLMSFKDDQGEPFSEGEPDVRILAHPTLRGVMEELFKATVISSTTNTLVGQAKVYYSSRLSNTSNWYMFDVSGALKPFIKQVRKNIEFSALEGQSENGFLRKKYLYGVNYRVGMGYGLWQKALKIA